MRLIVYVDFDDNMRMAELELYGCLKFHLANKLWPRSGGVPPRRSYGATSSRTPEVQRSENALDTNDWDEDDPRFCPRCQPSRQSITRVVARQHTTWKCQHCGIKLHNNGSQDMQDIVEEKSRFTMRIVSVCLRSSPTT
jgi:ribosomal protein L37AE/L43A